MIDIRKRLFIIIGISVGILLAILFAILFFQKKSSTPNAPVLDTTSPVLSVPTTTVSNNPVSSVETPVSLPTVSPTDAYILQFTRDFVEQYATYSTQNNNNHLTLVRPFVTERMSSWLDIQAKQDMDSDVYRGVTTRVITSAFVSKSETTVTVEVTVQQEYVYRLSSNVRYRSATVSLIKNGESWLVDSLYWKES